MPTLTIEYTTEAERLRYERMIAYVQELNRVGATAAPGTVLDACGLVALDQGRKTILQTLEVASQARIDSTSQTKSPATARKGTSAGS